jgi:hypothetical protein
MKKEKAQCDAIENLGAIEKSAIPKRLGSRLIISSNFGI